ncbi:MAG TPA: hypothetical protein PK765_05210 [bacterium]|nr:hypothetical protein [bacterium]
MFYNLRYENVVFFFGVLFVEDTVLFVAEADAGETMFYIHTKVTIIDIANVSPNMGAKHSMKNSITRSKAFIALFSLVPDIVPIVTITHVSEVGAVFAVLEALTKERLVGVF